MVCVVINNITQTNYLLTLKIYIMTLLVIFGAIALLLALINKSSKNEEKKIINNQVNAKKESNDFKRKTLDELKEEDKVITITREESKGIAALTEHIEHVVKTHPQTVKQLTKLDKKALNKVTRRNKSKKQ